MNKLSIAILSLLGNMLYLGFMLFIFLTYILPASLSMGWVLAISLGVLLLMIAGAAGLILWVIKSFKNR